MHDQFIGPERGIEFHEPILLNHTGLYRPRDILHVHGGSPLFLSSALGKRLINRLAIVTGELVNRERHADDNRDFTFFQQIDYSITGNSCRIKMIEI
ncbi:hypothetical protein [Burkholderia sp. 3C]